MSVTEPAVRLVGVSHRYGQGPRVIDDVSLEIGHGQAVALVGPSGSGKTTLLSIIGLLISPESGSVWVDGAAAPESERRRHRLRKDTFSWVFQSVNVLGNRTILDNVVLGLLAGGVSRRLAEPAAREALTRVGLADRSLDRTVELSGGEAQRVCIARAVATSKRVLLADEPTGQLDRTTSSKVVDALWSARHPGSALIVATHDLSVAKRCERILRLVDGQLVEGCA